MLKHLQKSVEEEELVWKSKMATSEEQLRVVSLFKSHDHMMHFRVFSTTCMPDFCRN